MEVIDTYEAPAALTESSDSLARFREQVRAEQAEKSVRTKMSDTALAKFRAQKESDRLTGIDNERLQNALRSVVITPENLRTLISRCCSPAPVNVERRVAKLEWWINAGYELGREIDSLTLISFFSELTADEITMSDSKFA